MSRKFLQAEWRKLILANYVVNESLLQPFLPAHTELDHWNGKLYVSLVGFMFLNTKVLGVRIPYHINFPEVNLRFYVKHYANGEWKRGVVFIKELVTKPAVSFVANTFFNENYETLPIRYNIKVEDGKMKVGYEWKKNSKWNNIQVTAPNTKQLIKAGSKEEFITQHFWGYSKQRNKTTEYEVAHPLWESYSVEHYQVSCDFGALYGKQFSPLSEQLPESVMFAEGSGISVFNKKTL